MATPSLSNVPLLVDLLGAIGLSENDVSLRLGTLGVAFGITKSWNFNLPRPFTGPANVTLGFALDSETKGVALGGEFNAGLKIPYFKNAVDFSVGAQLSSSAVNGLAARVTGSLVSVIE